MHFLLIINLTHGFLTGKKAMKNTRFVILILGTFHLSALLTLLSCSKPSSTQPEPKRPQIEVTEDITEDTVWETGKDIKI